MKKIVYVYNNGTTKVHTKYLKNKTMLKEANGAGKVDIYECDEYHLENMLNGNLTGKYITTKLLK